MICACYNSIYIPKQVAVELNRQKRHLSKEAIEFIEKSNVAETRNKLLVQELDRKYKLGKGEIATLVLACELNIDDVILANGGAEKMFEKEGRRSTDILIFGKNCLENRIITEGEFVIYLKGLHKVGYRPARYQWLFGQYEIK